MSAMYNPPHPGAILADTVLRADGGISVTAFAEKLKMTRAAISSLSGRRRSCGWRCSLPTI